MLKVFLHHLFRDVARAPCSIPDCPEVLPPILFPEAGVFFLKTAAGSPFHPLEQIRQRFRRCILDMHGDVVCAHYSFENSHVFGVADLHEQVPTPDFDVACQHMVTILRDPDDMCRQPRNCMTAVPVLCHQARLLAFLEVCSN